MENEMNNNKIKNKKIIIISAIVLLVLVIAGIIYYIWYKNEYDYLDKKGFFRTTCEVSKDNFNENEVLKPSYTVNYGKNDIVDCGFEYVIFSSKDKDEKISEIVFPITDDSRRYDKIISVESSSNLWDINNDGKNYIVVAKNKYADYSDLNIKVKINRLYITNLDHDNDSFISFGDFTYKLFDDKKVYKESGFSEKIITYKYRALVNEAEKTVKFYKLDDSYEYKLANEYTTKSSPYIDFDSKNGVALIYDNENTVLYNVEEGVIGKYKMGPVTYNLFLKYEPYDYSDLGDLLYVHGNGENEKYGIIDKDGNVKHDFTLNGTHSIGHGSGRIISEEYSLVNNVIIDKKDGKYGISKIDSNEMAVEYIYDDIVLMHGDYYMGKNDGKWKVYTISSGKTTMWESYDMILELTDKILLVQEDGYLYFTDYNGKHLTEKNIKVLAPYLTYWERGNTKNAGITYEVDGSIIKVTTYFSNDSNDKSRTYTFFTDSNNLYDR